MNNLVIQLYDSIEDENYYKCFGLNELDFKLFINTEEEHFYIHYVCDKKRHKFVKNYFDYKAQIETNYRKMTFFYHPYISDFKYR